MLPELRFALIGCGNIGKRHAEQMARVGKLIAICDIIPEKMQLLARNHPARQYLSLESLLQAHKTDINVLVVCTPNGLHSKHAISGLEAGMDVLCEKPLAITVKSGEQMLATAGRMGRKLFVVKQNRYNPPVKAVKDLLDQNLLGKVGSFQLNCFWNRGIDYYQNSWKGSRELDGGTLYTQFSHFIDLLYWFLGRVETASGFLANAQHEGQIEFEDSGAVILRMQSGAIGTLNYTVNAFDHNMEGSLTLFGEKGTVKIGGQYLNVLEYQSIDGTCISGLPTGNQANDYGTYTGSMSNHDKIYDDLRAAIFTDTETLASAADGLETLRIVEMIYSSATFIPAST